MLLIDLLSVVNENKTVYVWDPDCNMVASYDGKNSIDEKFNNNEVLEVSTVANALLITINI